MESSSVWSWTDGTPFDFSDWKHGEPQNLTGHNCAAQSLSDGTWSAQDCFNPNGFVCETSPTPTYPPFVNCSHGWIYFGPTHSCYGGLFGYNTKADWKTAENLCQNQQAHLPSIHTFEELQFLGSMRNSD